MDEPGGGVMSDDTTDYHCVRGCAEPDACHHPLEGTLAGDMWRLAILAANLDPPMRWVAQWQLRCTERKIRRRRERVMGQ